MLNEDYKDMLRALSDEQVKFLWALPGHREQAYRPHDQVHRYP